MTLLIAFHQSGFRCFKTFYLGYACPHLRTAFPRLVSYNRFIEFTASVACLLAAYLRSSCFGRCEGVSFVDSTALRVCHNRRIGAHRVFSGTAQRGKTSVTWFYGFTLHLAINHKGELLRVALTKGNIHDTTPIPALLNGLFGKVFADKGYVSELLRQQLSQQGIELITKARKNMKPRLLSALDSALLGKRGLIESVIGQLKNTVQIEHTRHRTKAGFLNNLFAALIAYCLPPKKPSLEGRLLKDTVNGLP